MKHLVKWCAAALLLGIATPGWAEESRNYFATVDGLPPDARFRQLSLMLMVSDGADDALVEALASHFEDKPDENGPPGFDFEDYTTPLIRIVDRESMLAGATRLFRFTRAHAGEIARRLEALQSSDGESVTTVTRNAISEDAIIIRNAIADSIDYTFAGEAENEDLSREYRTRTIRLRNSLEFEQFAAELERITREAVASVGGQTEAYQRMFDDEVDTAALDKKIEAAEYVYGWDPEFDERAARLAEEILNNIWDRESDVDP